MIKKIKSFTNSLFVKFSEGMREKFHVFFTKFSSLNFVFLVV